MLPNKDIRLALGTYLGNNSPIMQGAGTENNIALVINAFVPSETLLVGSLTFANFTGSTPIDQLTGPASSGVDPLTGEVVLNIDPISGVWRWTCTVAPGHTNTIYGWALMDHAGAVVLASELLPAPITIANVGDQIEIDDPKIRFVLRPMS